MTVSYASRMSRVRPLAIWELLRLGADPEIISFGGGYPDQTLFPVAELQGGGVLGHQQPGVDLLQRSTDRQRESVVRAPDP